MSSVLIARIHRGPAHAFRTWPLAPRASLNEASPPHSDRTPRSAAHSAGAPVPEPAGQTDGRLNERPVFIIDDDVDSHFLLKRQLSRIGVTSGIVCATDGHDAVTLLEEGLKG